VIYSVWDWNRRQFALYQDARMRPLMADAPKCATAVRAGVGGMVDVNMTLCPLPRDAQPYGWSDVAVGQLSRPAQAGGAYAPSGRAPGLGGESRLGSLGGGMLFSPGLGGGVTAGVAPGLGGEGLGFTFTEAVVVNVLVSLVAGFVSTYVFRNAFVAAGRSM
jgi:hypothetical protein